MKKTPLKSLVLLALLCAAQSFATMHIYGLYMAQANEKEDGNRYYQDTMFSNYKPSATFDGCVDCLVLKDFYTFGNNLEGNEYVYANCQDKGQKAKYVAKGTCSGVNIKCLDPEAYKLLNPVTGQTATAGTPSGYVAAANMRRTDLYSNAILEEGTNRFTIVCPQANELLSSAMVGLYLHEGDEPFGSAVIPKQGTPPDLCAKEAGAGTQDMEGENVPVAPNPRKDCNYFQPCPYKIDHPSLSCVKGDYRIEISYFYLAGSNQADVNENGLTSPPSCSWVSEGDLDPSWLLVNSPGNELAYMEIVMAKASPQPVISTPSILLSGTQNSGEILIENKGAGQVSYTASTTSTWLAIDSEAQSGTFTLQQKIPFSVKRAGFEPGTYTSYVTISMEGFAEQTVKVQMIVKTPATGAVRLAGLHIMGSVSSPAYYQDTMIASTTPAYSFDGGAMDILLVKDTYLFGNDDLIALSPYSDYLASTAKDLGQSVQYEQRGSFQGSNTVLRLDQTVYPLINCALDNGDKPECDQVSDYIKTASVIKQPLDCYLQPGTNRFTLVLPEASEFESEAMQLGLFLGSPNTGAEPDLAAVDDELFFDAKDCFYIPYTVSDLTYLQEIQPGRVYADSTLKCQKGDYEIELTKFFLLGQNDEYVNPYGMTSPAAGGYVATGGNGTTAWPIHASPDTTLGYFEVVVNLVPEPSAMLFFALAMLGLLDRRLERRL